MTEPGSVETGAPAFKPTCPPRNLASLTANRSSLIFLLMRLHQLRKIFANKVDCVKDAGEWYPQQRWPLIS